MSTINVPPKSKIILPDDDNVKQESFRDLLVQELTEFEEDPKDDDDVKRNTLLLDEIPNEDFFEAKPDEQEEKFGEIQGMTAVSQDEEGEVEEDATKKEEELAESADQPPDSVIVDASVPTEDKGAEVSIEPTTEDRPFELEEDTGVQAADASVADVVSSKEIQEDDVDKARVSNVTVLEVREDIDQAPTSVSDQKSTSVGTEEEARHRIEGPESRLARPSTVSARSALPRASILYDLSGRIDIEQDIQEFFELDKQEEFRLPDDFDEGLEEESAHTVVEEEEEALDRTPYYEKYEVIMKELSENRIRNNILQKIVIMYLRRRKVENILKDSEPPLDQLNKYGQKLDIYEQLMRINSAERHHVSTEVETLRKRRDDKSKELEKLFKNMQTREGNIGYGLIYSKTGNQIPDKLVERLIRRQSYRADQVSVMRLKYIKLKDMVQEKLDAIERIDTIENNLHLTDYEQLKAENRSHADKIEEKDEELTRLRSKCQNTIQILAHMREKSAALDSDLFDLREEFEMVQDVAKDFRENLAELKHSRDKYRQMAKKIKDESGLLTKLDLLIDMETSQEEVVRIEAELARCKEDAESKTQQVRHLRKSIERITEVLRRRAARARRRKTCTLSLEKKSRFQQTKSEAEEKVYKRRSTLYVPIIKDTSFDGLVKIKPTPFTNTRRRR